MKDIILALIPILQQFINGMCITLNVIDKKLSFIDLMHKSWSRPCILGNGNLRIVIGHFSQRVTNNNA